MKIAFVTDALFPDKIGGIQKYSTELVKALAWKDCQVDVYLQQESIQARQALEGIPGLRVFTLPDHKNDRLPGKYLRGLKRFSREVFTKIAEEKSADIIYAQGFTGWYACTRAWQRTSKIPVLFNLHGLEMYQRATGWKAKLIQLYFRRFVSPMLHTRNFMVVLGDGLKQLVKGVNPDLAIFTIPNGIDPSWARAGELKKASQKRHFLFVGRYEWRKGIDTLHEALRRVIASGVSNWEMHFVGDIPKEKQMDSAYIHYHGMVRDEQILKTWYQSADVLVCPSYSEGMPTVILEAMAAGLAVIATDVGATTELVNSKNGSLIAPFDVKGLAEAVNRMVSMDETALKGMGLVSRQRIENEFAWPIIAEKHMKAFEQIIVQ